MSTKRKALRYGLKKQEENLFNKRKGIATNMKLLRSVLAVGFAMTPWLGGDALAAGQGIVRVDGATGVPQSYLQNGANTAEIFAEQASKNTGLNRFKYFDVGAGQIANLYFQKQGDNTALNTLVNTVENQISISGTVNAVRNNKIGGNLYFLSPKGMVVGAEGVINAGALTVITSDATFDKPEDAAAKILENKWSLDPKAKIEINGKINTATGIDLRAAYIDLVKANDAVAAPSLKTGVVFKSIVNMPDGGTIDYTADGRLTATKDSNGNIVILDPSSDTSNNLFGDGSIKLIASSNKNNAETELWGKRCDNTVEAIVNIGQGAKVDALGNVNVSATATRDNNNTVVEFWDMMAFSRANVNIDGDITGNNVNVSANATSYYEAHNAKDIFVAGSRLVNRAGEVVLGDAADVININEGLATALYDKLLESGVISGKREHITNFSNFFEQLYMPFAYADAKATITQGANSTITASADANFSAISTATNKETISLQPHLAGGQQNPLDHFGGGLVYADTTSNAAIKLKGNVHATGNLITTSKAVNTSVGSLVLKFPKVVVPDSSGSGDNKNNNGGNNAENNTTNTTKSTNTPNLTTTTTGSPYVAAAIVVNLQDTDAVVEFGTKDEPASAAPKITAGGGLVATAASVNTLNSSAVIAEKDDTAVNTAVNVGVTSGNANVNVYTSLQGGKVQLNSQNVLNSLSMTTDASSGVEASGLDWTISQTPIKNQVQSIGEFLGAFKDGGKTEGQANKGMKKPEWYEAFNVGASLSVAVADNKALTNVASNAKLISYTDLDVLASSTVGDTVISTKNLYNNMGRPEYVAVSTAVGIEVLENTAEVNIADAASSAAGAVSSGGNVNISATADNAYHRVDKLIAAVESGWADFLAHWADWDDDGVAEKVQDLQEIVADILAMRANDPALRFADSKQYLVKSKAAIDLVTQLTGTDKLKSALEALCNAANYANMYVSASTDKAAPKIGDAATVATAAIGVQYLENNAKVNIGANRSIVGGNDDAVKISAKVIEQDANLIGKWSFIPDMFNTNAGATGIGGSVNVQTAYNTSEVIVNKGVTISAGDVNIATDNDVVNIGLVMGGAKTSAQGITGMGNYMGGSSHAQTLVDDDVTLTAQKIWGSITEKDENGNDVTHQDYVTKGEVNITADNNAVVVNLVGDVGYSEGSAVGVSLGVTDYNIKTLAQLQNLEESDTDGKGSISANSVNVNAYTDGVINTLTVAGSASSKEKEDGTVVETNNANKDAGGIEMKTEGGKGQAGVAKEGQELKADTEKSNAEDKSEGNNTDNSNTENGAILTAEQGDTSSANDKKPAAAKKKESSFRVDLAGSVSWNYVVDETKASLDNVNITLTRPSGGTDVTTGVSVLAEDSSYSGSYSGAAAISKIDTTDKSKFSGSLSGAIAVNDIYKTTEAKLNNTTITNADNVNNKAQNSGAQVAVGLSTGLAIGQRGNGVDINLGGSGSANYVDSTVMASMSGNTMTEGALNVNNTAYDKDVQVGGGVSFELAKGDAVAGAAISINDVDNDIQALMQGNTIGNASKKAGKVNNLAVSNLVQVGTATSVGVLMNSGYAMADVAIAVNMVDNQVKAQSDNDAIYASSFANAARDGKLETGELDNEYIDVINSTQNNGIQVELGSYTSTTGESFVINVDGEYVYSDPSYEKYGEIVPEDDRPDSLSISINQGKYYVLNENGEKQYLQASGSAYVYEDDDSAANLVNLALNDKLAYDEATGKYYDKTDPNNTRAIVLNTQRTHTLNGEEVDATATVAANIVDLNADAALANANGSTGADFALNIKADGSVNEDKHYSSSEVYVSPRGNVIVGSAIGVAVKAGGETTSVGAAAATNVNDVTNNFDASVSGGIINVSGTEGVSVKAESNTVMVAVAAGSAVSVSSGGLVTVDVAGSGVANTIDNDTVAKVENSTITASKLDVDAATSSILVSVAGQLGVAVTSSYGGVAGLTWAQNSFDNITGAYVRGVSLNGYDNGNTALNVHADNNSDMYTIGAGVSAAVANGAAAGAYAANYGNNSTEAVVEKYAAGTADAKDNVINKASSIAVQAEDDSDVVTVAGSLEMAVSPSSAAVTVGGAVANTNIGTSDNKQSVRAALNDATITMSGSADASDAASVSVQALNDANVVNLALGGGVAVSTSLVGVSAEGSVSVADVHSGTLATMNNVNLTADSKNVEVLARTDGDIVSSADAFNAVWGSTAEVGAGATVSVLNSDVDTKANVNGGSWSIKSAQIDARGINSLYDIAMGFNAGGSTVAAVNAQGNIAVNTLCNDVEALVHNANITASGDVSVEADSDETLHNYAGLLAGAGSATASVGLGATVVVNTINGNTVAEIQNGALQADDVDVYAHNMRRVNSSQTGIGVAASAEGAGTVVGSVSVHDLEGTTKALVHNVNGSVHSLDVKAERDNDIDTYNNGFALSGAIGSASVGAGVTVLNDKSATLATLSSSKLTASGSKDATNKVQVTADNNTDVHTEVSTNALAVSLGAALGVTVEVVNLDAQTSTNVIGSELGTASRGFAGFDATATNVVASSFENAETAISTAVGIGVGVGVLNINTQTTTVVDNAKAYADNINIAADETRNVQTALAGVNAGAGNVGVNLMYTNIGGQLQDVYSYDYGDGKTQKEYCTTKTDDSGLALSANVQGLANDALATTKADVHKLESNGLVASGSSGNAILQAVNKGSGAGKVETRITGGSELHAAQSLAVEAQTTNNVTGGVYQGAVAAVNVGVMANRIDVQENQQVVLDNSTLIANKVNVDADVLGYVNSTMGMGVVGAVGYSDVVAEVQHSGTNSINITGSSISATGQGSTASGDPLQINASNSMAIDNQAVVVGAESLKLGRTVLKGSDNLAVNVALGSANSQLANSFTAESIALKGLNAPNVKNHIGAGVNIGLVTGQGTIVESDFGGSVGVSATSHNTFAIQKLALIGQVGESIDPDASVTNREYTIQADNLAVNVAGEDISVNKAITANNAQLTMNVGAIGLTNGQAAPDVEISALNYATSKANVEAYSITGIASIGTNFAETEDNSTISLTVDGGATGLKAHNLLVQAEKNTEVYSNAYGATSGLIDISPYAAAVDHASTSDITVNIEGNVSTTGALNVQANGNDRVNLKADALTVTGAGEGDAHVDTSITSNTIINVKDASLTSEGELAVVANNKISLNKGESKSQTITDSDDIDLNDNNEYSEMLWGQGYGLGVLGLSGINNTVSSTAKVRLNNASLLSNGGNINVAGYTNEDLLVNGYLFSVGLLGNGSKTTVINTITNDDAVELEGSSIMTHSPGKALALSAADDLKLFTYALTEAPAGAIGGTGVDLKDTITRTNKVTLKDANNSLYSTQDINLYAGKKLDGNVAVFDLDAEAKTFNGNVIPSTWEPNLENIVEQNNIVTIGANSTSNSVRHTNIYGDAGQELTRVLSARNTGYGGSSNGGYVTEADGDEKYEKTSNNKVDINGSVTAGSGNVIHITIGDPGNIAIFDANDRAALTGKTALDEDELKDKITIEADPITGITLDSINLGRANYSVILANRYNEVMKLMNEYAKDGTNSAAYLGYKAEADRLMQEMLAYGSVYQDNNGQYHMTASNYVDYVELPQLIASGGNINIQTDTVHSSSGKGSMQANGSADINIVNNTNLLLKLDQITVDSDGGKIVYNNQVVSPNSDTTASFNEKLSALNTNGTKASFVQIDAKAGAGSSITVLGNYAGTSLNYKYLDGNTWVTGQYKPMADIWVEGNILNQSGAVTITSAHNNIRIAAENPEDSVAVLGTTVALTAGGSISQNYTAGIVNVGGNVKDDYKNEYQQMINSKTDVTVSVPKEWAPSPDSKATGSYIAGGSIYINATDININGVIQSGYGDYYLDLSSGSKDYTAVNTAIAQIKQSYTATGSPVLSDDAVKGVEAYKVVDGGAYWDSSSACYKYKLNAYYNPSTDKIIVEDVDASGGKVYLTGRIVNTGYGNIVCLDGASNITITNSTQHRLQVDDLLTHDVEGIISITDTAAYTVKQNGKDTSVALVTTIKNGSTQVQYLDANGEYITPDAGSQINRVQESTAKNYDYTYAPKTGLRYTWTSGKESTQYKRYEEKQVDGAWGLWSRDDLNTSEVVKEWSEDKTPIETGTNENADRPCGAVIKDSNNNGSTVMDYTHTETTEHVYTVESDTVDHSGVFGCHENHHVIWTETWGELETYYADVKADQYINISFVGNDANTAKIDITSPFGVDITGNIGNTQVYKNEGAVTEKGLIGIKAGMSSIVQNSGNLYGSGIELRANQGIKDINIVAGDNVALLLLNMGSEYVADANITVNSAVGAKGNLLLLTSDSDVGQIGSKAWKNLDITNNSNQGDIISKSNNINAKRVNLNTNNGSIYGIDGGGQKAAFLVNVGQLPSTGASLSASLNASAYGDINIKQANGDLSLGRVYSKTGDVTLEATTGSLVDALPTEVSNKGTIEERVARWKSLGMIDGEGNNTVLLNIKKRLTEAQGLASYEGYDENALLYTVAESIVNPSGSNLTKTSSKDPNIIGHNITLIAGDSIGYNSGKTKEFQLNGILKKTNGAYETGALDNLQALSNADITNVSIKTDAQGNTIAFVQDKQAVGIQQITSLNNPTNGKLTVTASGGDSKGHILLEGRTEVGNDSFLALDNKGNFVDIYVDSISSSTGEVNLTSLGSIFNNGGSDANIKGKSLYVTAVGALGTASKMLTTDIFGTSKTADGLSSVAGGDIYLNQTSDNNLILRNISSSADAKQGNIYIGANKSILMGTNGTEEDYYLRADGVELTIEAHGGSIGAAVSDNSGISHTDNDGVRIKNADAADTASKVMLKAKDNVYVKGVTSSSTGEAAQGVLNLEVDPVSGATLQNIGIVVDGNLHLLDALNSSSSASVYTTIDLLLDNNIEAINSKDIYLGSAVDVTVAGTQQINGTNSVTVQAGNNVLLETGYLASKIVNLQADAGKIDGNKGFVLYTPTLNANAKGDILLDSEVNQLQQVNVANTKGRIAVGNGNVTNADLSIAITTPNAIVGGDLTVHNYAKGEANNIVLADKLQATGNISIINEESHVGVSANADISAQNITLQAVNHNVVVAGGKLNAADKVLLDGVNVTVSGGAITAAQAVLEADNAIAMSGGSIVANATSMTAGAGISLDSGSIVADTAVLTANNGAILEGSSFVLDAVDLQAEATGAISLASQSNQLANVQVGNTKGDIIVYNGNTSGEALHIGLLNEGAKVNGSLTIHNFDEANGAANAIVLNKELAATGNISLINDEADVTVGEGASIEAQNITLQADKNAIAVNGGTIAASGTATLKGQSVSVSGGELSAASAALTASTENIALNSGSIAANEVTLTATKGAISEVDGFALSAPVLNTSAAGATTLLSKANQLEQVNITEAGGSVTIGSANSKNSNALQVITDEQINGDLTVTNYDDESGKNNAILVSKSLQAAGDVILINEEAAITVNSGAALACYDVALGAKTAMTINGSVNATRDASLSSGAGMTINGNVSATRDASLKSSAGMSIIGDVTAGNDASLTAGQDFIQNAGTIAASDVAITAQRNVLLNGGSMAANNNAELVAQTGAITENNAYTIDAPALRVNAGSYISLGSKANQLVNVDVEHAGGNVTIGSGNSKSDAALAVKTAETVKGNLVITNYASANDSKKNAIVVADNLKANGDITITNQEADISVNDNAVVAAANIKLQADGNAVNVNGSKLTANDKLDAIAKNISVNGGELQAANATLDATTNVVVGGGSISASSATLSAGENITHSAGSIIATTATLTAGQDIAQNGGSVSATTANLTAGGAISQTAGSITATNANLTAGTSISQGAAGSIVVTNTVAKAGADLSLASNANKLQNVSVDAQKGNATIVSGNDVAGELNVQTVGEVGNNLIITNVANGEKNEIKVNKNFKAKGDITITNAEAAINVTQGASVSGKNINLTATAADVVVNGGTITAKLVGVKAPEMLVSGGTINATTVQANNAMTMAGGTITATRVASDGSMTLAGGTVNAANVIANGVMNIAGSTINTGTGEGCVEAASINMSAGQVTGNTINMTATGDFTQSGGSINATNASLNANAIALNGGSIVANEATLTATNGAITEEEGFALETPVLNTSAAGVSNLLSHSNQLEQVNITKAGSAVNIGSANRKNSNALQINTAEQIKGDLTVTNYDDKSGNNNAIVVPNVLQAAGNITLTNEEAGITVDSDASLSGVNVTLNSIKALNINGNVHATNDAILTSGESISVNGSVTASHDASLTSGESMSVNGSVTASHDASLSSGADLTVSGSVDAGNDASLTANAALNIAKAGVVNAANTAKLTAYEIAVAGNVTARNAIDMNSHAVTVDGIVETTNGTTTLTSTGDLTLSGAGFVKGNAVKVEAGNTFTQAGSTIETDAVTIDAQGNILLNAGSLHADNAKLLAGGYIDEDASDYDLQVAQQLQLSAGGSNEAGVAISLDSTQNKLYDVLLGDAQGDVLIGNGSSGNGRLSIQALANTNITGKLVVHNYNNLSGDDIGNNLRVIGSLQARDGIELINDERDITMGSLTATDIITSDGDIVIQAANNIRNAADIKSSGGDVKILATYDVINDGIVETASGDITLRSTKGIVFNDDNADLLSSNGSVTLRASAPATGTGADYFYYTVYNETTGEVDKYTVAADAVINTETAGAQKGRKYVVVNGAKHYVFHNGSVYNAGDIIAMNGTITLQSDEGNVANFNDFKAFTKHAVFGDSGYQDKDITNGSIIMSAAKGELINNVNLEAGQDVKLTAKEGLNSFGYEIFAGEDITLTATAGNLVNTSTLESVKGDVTLTAEHGNVVNDKQGDLTVGKGDIITLGGTVTLKAGLSAEEAAAKGQSVDTRAFSVTNYGDIIAVNKFGGDSENAGSIILKSEYGNIYNCDDFNEYSKAEANTNAYECKLAFANHKSAGLSGDIGYNVANNNVTLSAVNGSIISDKDYIVALGNVTLEAQDGIESAGRVILAGGNINLTDTEGDIANTAQLISVNGDITLLALTGSVDNLDNGNIFALNGNVRLEAQGANGNVVNNGDLVALNGNNVANKGGIELVSKHGNVENYDEFKDVDGRNTITFDGVNGYGRAKFNPNTPFAIVKDYILADADLLMEAREGSLKNTMNMNVAGDITLISGENLVIGENVSNDITAGGNVTLESVAGKVVMDGSNVQSTTGSVDISGDQGVNISGANVSAAEGMTLVSEQGTISVKENSNVISEQDMILWAHDCVAVGEAEGATDSSKLESLNGSLSAVAVYGDVNIGELAAADMVAAGSGTGNVVIGSVDGKSVVLYTEGAGKLVTAGNVKVKDALVLQGDNITATNVDRSANNGQLLVDLTGSAGGAMKGELNLAVDVDVRFTTTSVTDATITIDGTASFDKLHSEGKLEIVAPNMVTAVYGKAPYHDDSNYLYYDLGGTNTSSSGHEQIRDEYFGVNNALHSIDVIKDRIEGAANGSGPASLENGGWMYLYIDSPTYQRSNGLLLHIDTGYRAANQRWTAEDLSGKLADFKSHDAFIAHYGDMAGIFGRYGLIDFAPRSVGQIVQDVQAQKVTLQQSNGQLRIAAVQKEQDEDNEREKRSAANE